MEDIEVHRYEKPEEVHYKGWIEPASKSWILFIAEDGTPVFFAERDATGAVK